MYCNPETGVSLESLTFKSQIILEYLQQIEYSCSQQFNNNLSPNIMPLASKT